MRCFCAAWVFCQAISTAHVITTQDYLRGVGAGKKDYPVTIPLESCRPIIPGARTFRKLPMWVHALPEPHNVTSRKDEEGIEEYYSNILDSTSDLAFICPYERLEEFHDLFPQLEVNHYESADDFWMGVTNSPRKTYETIVDLSRDEQLWTHSEEIIGRSRNEPIRVDCIVFAQLSSEEAWVARGLASCMWPDGIRQERPILNNPKVLVSDIGFEASRFPVSEAGATLSLMMPRARGIAPAFEYLKRTCDGCGWFSGEPEISFLVTKKEEGGSRNALVDAGTEHLHVLPVDEDQVIEWIDNGMVARKEVFLHDTKWNKYAFFKPHIPKLPRCEKLEPALYATGAKIMVFYCNHASSSSPTFAAHYLQWLRTNYPESRQQVKILHHGMGGLSRRVEALGRKDFLHIYGSS